MSVYYAILTTAGQNKIAAFATGGPAVNISVLAVGDANGAYYDPTGAESGLVHQVWQGAVNQVYTHPNNPNWIVVEAIIPASAGGFDIREACIRDDAGVMIAISKYPLTNKPAPGSGSEKDIYVRMIFQVANTAAVSQMIDPSLIMATREYVDARMPRHVKAVATGNVGLTGLIAVDDINLAVNDRLLVAAQTDPKQNGIYGVQEGAWTRALDCDNSLEVLANMLVVVERGTVNSDTIWMLTTDAPITLGTSSLTFVRIFPDETTRTISDTTAPSSNTGTPTILLSWLANMIKAITGKANWRTAPATTLEAAKGHMDAVAPHSGHALTNHGHANDANIGGPFKLASAFNWTGQAGQPSGLWGSNDGTNYYTWNPSNFNVNYANSAGNSDTTDGYHASTTPTTNTVPVRGSTGYVNQIYSGSFTGLTATGITVSGLDLASLGDGIFDVYITAKLTTAIDDYFRLEINRDSTAANYVSCTYLGGSYSDAVPAIGALYGTATKSFYHVRIYLMSGQYRFFRFWGVSISPTHPFFQGTSYWKSTNNITQLRLYSNSGYIIADGATVIIRKKA